MESMPQIKVSNGVLIGIAIGAAILAIVLFYENQQTRKLLVTKKPCGCQETSNIVSTATRQAVYSEPVYSRPDVITPAGIDPSVITGRLNSQPMPNQHPDNPDHPPEVLL